MEFDLLELLKDVVSDIDSLYEYYENQLKSIFTHIKTVAPKYRPGMILQRFFVSIGKNNLGIVISDEEKKEIKRLLKSYKIKKDDDGEESIEYQYNDNLKENDKIDPEICMRKIFRLYNEPRIFTESCLIMLLIKYEECIAGILKLLIENYPDAYLSDKSITYSELLSFEKDLQQVKQRLIDREIDEFMRMPVKEWYIEFNKRHKFNVDILEKMLNDFIPIYYIRNIIVHNKSIVNETYKKNVNDDKKIGDEIYIDDEFFNSAVSKTLTLIFATFWSFNLLIKNRSADLYNYLFKQGYDYMIKQQWEVSEYIYHLLMNDSLEFQDEYTKTCSKINYWVSIKNSKGIESIKEDIKTTDVSALGKEFLAAKFALLDDFSNLSEVLSRIINVEIPANYIKEWPLFLQYRGSEEYKEFLIKNKEKFETVKYKPSNESVESEETLISESGLSSSSILELKND